MYNASRAGWIGVDLGSRVAKLAQLERANGSLRLAAAAAVVRDTNASLRDDLRALRAVASRLRGHEAAATLSMSCCTLDALTPEESPSRTDCRDAWSPVDSAVYQLGADAARVEATAEAFTRAGVRCTTIDGAPLALARATEFDSETPGDELVAVFDWGETAALLVGAVNGSAVYARRLGSGGFGEFRRAVAERVGLSPSDAEPLLIEPPAEPRELRLLRDAVRDASRETIEQARRSLEHLGAKLRRPTPPRLLVTGAASVAPLCVQHLGEALGVDAAPFRAGKLDRTQQPGAPPDSLLAQAIALSALAWESHS
ncbi:hypothetical protein [Botrimarina sp.]|uniref:hypothetical protein n=1 Tax=Botrimarina sp. TaxID=2795802 RepID=UPI0032ED947D